MGLAKQVGLGQASRWPGPRGGTEPLLSWQEGSVLPSAPERPGPGDSARPAASPRGRKALQSRGVPGGLPSVAAPVGACLAARWAVRTRGCLSSVGGLSADVHIGGF